jgi:hypothetical protein
VGEDSKAMRVRLTDRFVKSATTGGRRSPIFMDDEVIGFGIQVRETAARALRSTTRSKAAGGGCSFAKIDCMSPELMMWFVLATKMAVTALFVTAATIIAERLGATVGALVATLPVSAGPVYVFLALDHDAAFISSSAVASLALNSATAIYLTAYVLLAQRCSMWLSISLAFAIWLVVVLVLSPVHWTAWSVFILNLIVFVACIFIVQPFCFVRMPPTTRPWYDFVLRAGLVALLVGIVVTLSFQIGPTGSGVLAVFPVIYMSIMLILHHRVGGPATAAVLANAVPALAGFGVALLTLHLIAIPLGSTAALIVALGVSVVWNAMIYAIRRRQALA